MPSHRYVELSANGRIKGFSTKAKGVSLVRGEVPLLWKNIINEPMKGVDIQDGKSNILVGTVSSTPSKITSGGVLLSAIQSLKFGKGVKRKSQENNKF